MHDTRPLILSETDFPPITRRSLQTLQVNLGYRCNQSCAHCHVNAGPSRTEAMSREVAELVVKVLEQCNVTTLDLTGGAPELNQHFRYIVESARALSIEVIDRCNLTILLEPDQTGLAEFLADNQVTVTASLPCYELDNVEKQRGKGVYDKSIEALRLLNKLGYGFSQERQLNLVYNPVGAHLPPSQKSLESEYKKQLQEQHSIYFDRLFTITNMPISRFGAVLLAQNQYDNYLNLLKTNYADENLDTVMCRDLISVDWQGYIYDCDFNQMLNLPLASDRSTASKRHLRDLLDVDLKGVPISVADHCFGCTAGQGSSCGGALGG